MIPSLLDRYVHHLRKCYQKWMHRNHFNAAAWDNKANAIASLLLQTHKTLFPPVSAVANPHHIALLATEIADAGGHTECIKNAAISFSEKYDTRLFFTRQKRAAIQAPKKIKLISDHIKIDGEDWEKGNFLSTLSSLFNKISTFSPKVLFVYIHMDDFLSAILISLLKKRTDIKIYFFNHASHFPSLGFTFSDLVIEGMPTTHYVTKHFRHIDKCRIVGLQSQPKEKNHYFSPQKIEEQRQKWGLRSQDLVTLSGGSSYKFFDKDRSPYLELLKTLLLEEPALHHVLITYLDDQQTRLLEQIFENAPEARTRLIIEKFTPDYDILFQSCDLFIDSFPCSSALTQIDMMRNKRPSVVKINREDAFLSFHEYLPENYPYMYDNVEEMKKGILLLLHDQALRTQASNMLYTHYLKKFEGSIVKEHYFHLIEHADSPSDLWEPLDDTLHYQFSFKHSQ